MSLFGSIKMGGNTLRAMQIGLQVVGNNIANANTPGFIREDAVYVPAPVQRQGNLILGLGVQVAAIVQKVDRFVQERLVGARGDRASADVQEQLYRDIEAIFNALGDNGDLNTAFTEFFNAIHLVLDEDSVETRKFVVDSGENLTQAIGNLHSRIFSIQQELNDRVVAMSDEINSLTDEIRLLNVQIASSEGGDTSGSDAGGLRVKRQAAVDRLSELIGIRADEQPSGGLSISVGGEVLVFEAQRREVGLDATQDDGISIGTIEFTDTHSMLNTTAGELRGLYTARDEITENILTNLDDLAATLAFEFNKVYSQGQGRVGFDNLTSVESVSDADAALDAAGLPFAPVGGKFDVLIHSKDGNLTRTTEILVDLNGFDGDTTLNSLAAQLDAINGLSASVTSTGELQLESESTDVEFAFDGDTSGLLAALGINTFFTGTSAGSLGINSELTGIRDNALKLAVSADGIGNDTENAVRLAAFIDEPLESAGNTSLVDLYSLLVSEVTQGSAIAQSVADGFRIFEGTLEGQAQAVSGVSIDEEAVKMITLQRIYQASARYIQTISELLDILVEL